MPHVSAYRTLGNIRYSRLFSSCRIAALMAFISLFFTHIPAFADNSIEISAPPMPFPAITFKDESGQTYSIDQQHSKLTLVHYWATWCGPCVKELPQLDAVQDTYSDKGLNVIAISMDGEKDLDKVKTFFQENNITHLKIYFDNGTAIRSTGIRGLPMTFFVNANILNLGTATGPVLWENLKTKAFIEDNLN